jgi:hypothetical protein
MAVDAEADADDGLLRDIERVDSCQASDVLDRRPKPCLITTHQDVGATVDKSDRIELETFGKRPIGAQQGRVALALEAEDRLLLADGREVPSQAALGEVARTGGRGADLDEAGRQQARADLGE